MKNFNFYTAAVFLLLTGACHSGSSGDNNNGSDAKMNKADSARAIDSTKTQFFPVVAYLEREVLQVDSIPVALRKYTTINGRMDSSFIQPPEFNALALQFFVPDLRNGNFEKNFTETSFMDKTTQSMTLTYSTTVPHQSLQRVDVQTSPVNGTNKVKSIYLETQRTSGDSLYLDRFYWKSEQSFQVSTTIQVKGKAPIEQQVKVVWNEEE